MLHVTGKAMLVKNLGFTLVEAIVVIVLIGIVAASIAVYVKQPVESYALTVRRFTLTEQADIALRQISRDLAAAVPNSARFDLSGTMLEFLHLRGGARYCNGNGLDCGAALFGGTTSVALIGPWVGSTPILGDYLVFGNGMGVTCDAWAATPSNRRTISAVTTTSGLVTGFSYVGTPFANTCTETVSRIMVSDGPVAFVCDPVNQVIWRYAGYAIQASMPSSIAAYDNLIAATGSKARVASLVQCAASAGGSGTVFSADQLLDGLIELRIQLKSSDSESVNLYRQVKVDNTL